MNDNSFFILRLLTNAPQCSKRVYRALKIFDNAKDMFSSDSYFFEKSGFSEDEIVTFFSDKTDAAEKYLEYCVKNDIKIITYYDAAYPSRLRELEEPPAALFIKGNIPLMNSLPVLGIVGTRDCTTYGGKFAAALSYDLSQVGFVIVSGMARGIDTYAHKGALLSGGITVAVLPSGVDIVTPSGNSELYSRICEKGAIVSEYLPGTLCKPYNFHLRNRVISGLSQAVVVVETANKGGSMITVRHALEQGRTIFAVPGSPGCKTSQGTNELIRSGASVCTGSEDILREYELMFGCEFERPKRLAKVFDNSSKKVATTEKHAVSQQRGDSVNGSDNTAKVIESSSLPIPRPYLYCALSEAESKVIDSLSKGAISVDEICDITGMIFPNVISILNGFELNGYVESLPGGIYKLKE